MEKKLCGDSADILIYRHDDHGEIEVLAGVRQYEPWKGHTTVPFGGHIEPSDDNILEAAVREVEEETGLVVCIDFFVGIYGPKRRHYGLNSNMEAVAIGDDRSSVSHVFAGRVAGGILGASAEQKNLRIVRPADLALVPMCFDHALVLSDFLSAMEDGSAKTWRREALKLIK